MADTLKLVMETIDRYTLFVRDEKVLVGVSGGPDSMTLLHVLVTLAPTYRLGLAVAHLNHGLRGDAADNDASFVKKTADQLNVPFHYRQAKIRKKEGSIEEQARTARYAFFGDVMKRYKYDKIALGHQKNDNAEAVLLHLLRGSGLRGLSGIPPKREGGVVRPLIQLDRTDIMAYLRDNKIPYVTDETNTDPAYDRNRIRHHLIPTLKEAYNPNIIDTLNRTADLFREEETWLTNHLEPLLANAVLQNTKKSFQLDSAILTDVPLAVQRRLIRQAIKGWRGNLRKLGVHHIDAVIELMKTGSPGKRINLPDDITAEYRLHHLYFTKTGRQDYKSSAEDQKTGFCYTINKLDRHPVNIDIKESRCRLVFKMKPAVSSGKGVPHSRTLAWFDADILKFPLRIRNFKPGDRISPYGMSGSQKIKKLFIDRKIDRAQRQYVPLLEGGGEILWAVGIRRSDIAPVTEQTRRILAVSVESLGKLSGPGENI